MHHTNQQSGSGEKQDELLVQMAKGREYSVDEFAGRRVLAKKHFGRADVAFYALTSRTVLAAFAAEARRVAGPRRVVH